MKGIYYQCVEEPLALGDVALASSCTISGVGIPLSI
jgi:hypothetical protein